MAETDVRSAESAMIAEARMAFFVVFALLAVVWAVQLGNWSDDNALAVQYAIRPHDLGSLPMFFSAPLLHFGWAHLESNSGPLFVFAFLAAYRGVARFLLLTVLLAVTCGLAVWIFQSPRVITVGASGLVFGYFAYVVLRGIFDRHLIDTLIGLVMAASFAYMVFGALPSAPGGVSWLDHLGGLVGGCLGAWLLRDRQSGGGPTAPTGPAAREGSGHSTPQAGSERSALLKELDDLGL
ncbi:rhomboid family intramembrane serine protease [Streptomyces tateyamensis]|uniref:Rhomboid family intramembrane serine protease n=1 Tax=Streptomyces tateyamensis TaxID=565073 RepID=A0A2V4NF57_9ACTN|nr:rhomboid family intramembrane serine protease [Streptomyces tateyamensis]PYC80549.1 rhomboid family intramembrane serine protease [Streptomyces tateyamensis]